MAGSRGYPSRAALALVATAAYSKFKAPKDGANTDHIPELAKVPSGLAGAVITTADRKASASGDVDRAFSMQSLSRTSTAALVMQEPGEQ